MARPRNADFKKDLFYFHRHDPGKGPLKEADWKLKFEAHITAISDSTSPGWQEYFDMGRPDPKVFYGSFSRQVNISFLVLTTEKKELEENHLILNKLATLTYPIYKPGQGYNAPHVKFQIGNLLSGFGVVTSLDFSWEPETPWVEHRPIYTNVDLGIKILADVRGNRPNADKSTHLI
jgi:hypothetical protein